MERQQIFDKVEEIWDTCQYRNIGSNEAELDFRETVTDWIQEQFKNLGLFSVSNSASDIIVIDTKIQLLPRKWWQIYKRGWQTHTDFFGRRYFVRYHWVK